MGGVRSGLQLHLPAPSGDPILISMQDGLEFPPSERKGGAALKMCALLILLAIISIAPAFADEPPEPCSITSLDAVQRLLLIPADSPPNPLGSFTVTVLSDGNCIPIPHAAVEVLIGGLLPVRSFLGRGSPGLSVARAR